MRRGIFAGILLFGLFFPVLLSAEDPRSTEGIKANCETFLQMVQAGDYSGAFSYLQSKPTAIPREEFSQIENSAVQQSETIRRLYGEAERAILIREQLVSGVALRLVYLVVRENLPIRWKFIYYKPDREWTLVSIEFDDKLEEVFQQ